MSSSIRVGIINYLNVLPFLYGLRDSAVATEMELVETYPAELARLLLTKQVDLGIVPVAILPEMQEYHIVSNYCIGCDGPVASVCLFSEVPVEEITTVYLDYQSRTSVALVQLLLQDYWKVKPVLKDAKGEDFRHQLKGSTAGVVIGDRAFEQRQHSTYIYDLGEAWKAHTGTGFVFAAWVAHKQLPDSFVQAFNQALEKGLAQVDTVVAENPYPLFDLSTYYRDNISYHFDASKRKGMDLFLSKLKTGADISAEV